MDSSVNCSGKNLTLLVSEPVCVEEKGGAHLWRIAFIVDIKHTVYSSGENEIICICDTELEYKCAFHVLINV